MKKDFETVVMGKNIQNQIKFVDSFLIAFKIQQSKVGSSLNLNLMNVSGSGREFSAAFLENK